MRQPSRRCEPLAQIRYSDFCSDMGAHAVLMGKGMKSCRTVNPITVQQSHGRHVEFSSALNKIFGQRGAFKKAECAGRMQFDIPLSHTEPLSANDPA